MYNICTYMYICVCIYICILRGRERMRETIFQLLVHSSKAYHCEGWASQSPQPSIQSRGCSDSSHHRNHYLLPPRVCGELIGPCMVLRPRTLACDGFRCSFKHSFLIKKWEERALIVELGRGEMELHSIGARV